MNKVGHLQTAKVLVIDDHPFSRITAIDLLTVDGYEVMEADGSEDPLEQILSYQPDLILLDVCLPDTTGFEICQNLKADKRTELIPVILMSVADEQTYRVKSRQVGADGFLLKPLDRLELLARTEVSIQKKRLNEWLEQIEQVLFLIAQTVEERYSNTKSSSTKLDRLVQSFGEYLQLSPMQIKDLILAACLHDIGTVMIPDAIMLKKGQLTDEERELIKRHVFIGEKIAQPLAVNREVPQIIRHHHERWDGSGYPDGLQGNDIPLLAQIFQILDIYDALTNERPYRPYKQAMTPTQALEVLTQEAAKGWRNPELVQQFTNFIGGASRID